MSQVPHWQLVSSRSIHFLLKEVVKAFLPDRGNIPSRSFLAQVLSVHIQDRVRLCQANVNKYSIWGLLTSTPALVGRREGISTCSRTLAVTVLCSSGRRGSSAFEELGAFNEVRFSLFNDHEPNI
jgi:hypothetical protein